MGRALLDPGEWGTIKSRRQPDGTWVAWGRIKDVNGELVRVRRSGDTDTKARRNLKDAGGVIAKRVEGARITSDTRFQDLAAMYLRRVQQQLAGSSYDTYHQTVRHVLNPRIGKLPISQCTPSRLQAMFDELHREGRAPGGLAAVKKPLQNSLQLAVVEGVLLSNPAKHLQLPKLPAPHHTQGLSEQDIGSLLGVAAAYDRMGDLEVYDVIVLLISTGARVSEILALRWQDIEFGTDDHPDHNIILIRKNAVFVNGRGVVLHDGKTRAANRRVRMNPMVLDVMRRRALNVETFDEPVFPVGTGLRHRDPRGVRWHLRKVYKDVPAMKGVKQPTHIFRRTAATMMYEAGMSVLEIANQLGHASVKMTWDVYLKRDEPSTRAASALDFSAFAAKPKPRQLP